LSLERAAGVMGLKINEKKTKYDNKNKQTPTEAISN
jgi:hypothetical protein